MAADWRPAALPRSETKPAELEKFADPRQVTSDEMPELVGRPGEMSSPIGG